MSRSPTLVANPPGFVVATFIESELKTAERIMAPASSHIDGTEANFPCGDVAILCRRCPEKSDANDDSAAVIYLSSDSAVLVVADGVGGGPAGHIASAIAVQTLVEFVSGADPIDDLRVPILDAIEAANREILELGIGAATTITVVQIQNGMCRAFNVGDSMTMLIGQRGKIKWKSLAHSPVGYAVESGMLDELTAMTHDDRHVISNYIGSQSMHIEIGPKQTLSRRDTIVMGSDGLFDNVHLEEIVQLARRGKPTQRVDSLASLATTRMRGSDQTLPGKPDDLTILLYTRS